ncbi:MAG: NAD(P)/FAD-dependent oxidoreductase [Candidatus Wallbacteria bacterium]|nr:NAD(P)/FAD-dependent oxidoreductase [Candidatus Wallbacteria bacterium]
MPVHYDVLIIGAGMSGLGAGIRLAHYGRKVCILDRHYLWGGLNSFYRLKGYRFDVGLHAMTNFVPRGTRNAPLTKLLRQLRIDYDELDLRPQQMSATWFPGKRLRFTNDFAFFESEVAEQFPAQADAFRRLVKHVMEYDALNLATPEFSAREVVSGFLSDPLLIEMLFCPLFFYGSAVENDMDFGQFVIMFKSIYCEGLARPTEGVRRVLRVLMEKYKGLGGELRMKSGVRRLEVAGSKVTEVVLDSGERLTADTVFSSAGYPETLGLLSDYVPGSEGPTQGQLSFMESIDVLTKEPRELGYEFTIQFFSTTEKFHYQKPEELVDVRSGVICCPNNFCYDRPLDDNLMRVTSLANHGRWAALPPEEYHESKVRWHGLVLDEVVKIVPDFRPFVKFTDIFTPKTVRKFTGHVNGAVYGSPVKFKTGRTRLDNLFLCGTDQGMLGIVGALLSGISMANMHVLQQA